MSVMMGMAISKRMRAVHLGNDVYISTDEAHEWLAKEKAKAHASNDIKRIQQIRKIESKLMSSSLQSSVIEDTKRLMEDLKIKFAVVGALAVGVYSHPRSTEDVDLLVDSKDVQGVMSNLKDSDYMRRFNFYKIAHSGNHHWILDHHKGQVELLGTDLPKQSKLRREALDSAKPVSGHLLNMPVVNPEHLIWMKLVAWKENPKREAKDKGDVSSIIVARGDELDKNVLRKIPDDLSSLLKSIDYLDSNKLDKLLGKKEGT